MVLGDQIPAVGSRGKAPVGGLAKKSPRSCSKMLYYCTHCTHVNGSIFPAHLWQGFNVQCGTIHMPHLPGGPVGIALLVNSPYQSLTNQNYFIAHPTVDQRAGQLSLPHVVITKTVKTELKRETDEQINPVNGLEPRDQSNKIISVLNKH